MTPKTIMIPVGLTFADLQLELAPDGSLLHLPKPLAELVRVNGGNVNATLVDEDVGMHWIAKFYLAHREAGGTPDPVVEGILAKLTPIDTH